MISLLRARLREFGRQLISEHTSPGRVDAAVWAGCVIGCTPLFGLHLAICVVLASVFRLNKPIMYAASNVSIPPLIPFIGFASVQIGERVLHGHWAGIRLPDFQSQGVRAIAEALFLDWLVGGVILGGVIGVIAALAVRTVVRWKAQAGSSDDAVGRAVAEAGQRYRGLPRKLSVYAWMKYRMDPCYRGIAALIPPGTFTVDLGTGLGMLPVVIALLGEDRRVLGIEWDPVKADAARHACRQIPAIEIRVGDIRTADLPPCDVIVLVDVLHYYDAAVQLATLTRCRAALRPGGRILVRDGDATEGRGARFTRTVERLATRLGWNRGPSVTFRDINAMRRDLESLGFSVTSTELSGIFHPGNVLLIAE